MPEAKQTAELTVLHGIKIKVGFDTVKENWSSYYTIAVTHWWIISIDNKPVKNQIKLKRQIIAASEEYLVLEACEAVIAHF